MHAFIKIGRFAQGAFDGFLKKQNKLLYPYREVDPFAVFECLQVSQHEGNNYL